MKSVLIVSAWVLVQFHCGTSDLRNNITGQLYTDALIRPMLNDLRALVSGERINAAYLPNDVAIVQMLASVMQTLSLVAEYIGAPPGYEAFEMHEYERGVAIQFDAIRCDNIASAKFHDKLPEKFTPWYYYRDSAYFKVACNHNGSSVRKRRDVEYEFFKTYGKEKRNILKRPRRATLNQNFLCGNQSYLTYPFGRLKFPTHSSNYTENIECVWTIQVPHGYAVEIIFDYFQLEEDKQCRYDSVEFFEGTTTAGATSIVGRLCGGITPDNIKSKNSIMTIRFISDQSISGGGFVLEWTVTDAVLPHPGFLRIAFIAVDNVGDLNVDSYDFSKSTEPEDGAIDENYRLLITDPTTCPETSGDRYCFFEESTYVISKLIMTGAHPNFYQPDSAIEVTFDHAIQSNMYPDLYLATKYCVTWASGVKDTKYGAWSRRNGMVYDTNLERTICRFFSLGVHAVVAEVPPPAVPPDFYFSLSWYFGLAYSLLWLAITLASLTSTKINIPMWLNMNQVIALMVFIGIVPSGMHLKLHKQNCSTLAFALYYFGVAVFVWHCLKAAQFTGEFDLIFAKGRNLYGLYLVLGWGIPFFIAGMAGGAKFLVREHSESCWMALQGGTIWGYTAPAYFLIMFTVFLYFHGWKNTKQKSEIMNMTKLRRRTVRDFIMLMFFVLTWCFGVLCVTSRDSFALQFIFCICLGLTTTAVSLRSKQRRRNFLKENNDEELGKQLKKYEEDLRVAEEDGISDEVVNEEEELKKKQRAAAVFKRWRVINRSEELDLAINVHGLTNTMLSKKGETYTIAPRLLNQWNQQYMDVGEPTDTTKDNAADMDSSEDENEEEDPSSDDAIGKEDDSGNEESDEEEVEEESAQGSNNEDEEVDGSEEEEEDHSHNDYK